MDSLCSHPGSKAQSVTTNGSSAGFYTGHLSACEPPPPPQQYTLSRLHTYMKCHHTGGDRKFFFCRKGKSYWLLFSSAPTAASKETSMRYCTHTLIFPEKKNSFVNSCKMWKQLFFETFLIVSVANVLSTLSFILHESSSLSTVRVIQRLSQVE